MKLSFAGGIAEDAYRKDRKNTGLAAYQSQYADNPYTGQDPTLQLSFWNALTDSLGFTNNAARVQYQQNQAAALWDSERSAALEDREYNNEVNTAARMRAAGLNPDLLGVEAGQSELANNDAVSNGVNGAVPTELNSPMQLLQGVGSVMSTIFSVYNGLASLDNQLFTSGMAAFASAEDGIKSDLVSKVASRIDKDSIDKFLSGAMDISELLKGDTTLAADSLELLRMITPQFKSKRVQDYARSKLATYVNSLDFQAAVADKVRGLSDSKRAAADSLGKNAALQGKSGGNLRQTMQTLASFAYDVFMSQQKSSKSQNDYYSDYYDNLSPELSAAAENTTNSETAAGQQQALDLNGPFRGLLRSLAKESEDGNVLSSIALTSMLGISSALGNPLISAAVSAATKRPR